MRCLRLSKTKNQPQSNEPATAETFQRQSTNSGNTVNSRPHHHPFTITIAIANRTRTMDQLKLRPCNCLTAHPPTVGVWVDCGRICTLRLASFQKGLSEKGCPRTPIPIEGSWSKRFRHFLFVSAGILWPRHGHLPHPHAFPQWKVQFSQSLLIFSHLCGCFVCCTIRCCCCWPSRKSVKS
ncbi:LOW QUALITY PROTEIN: uncharacterized protein Dyak_GE28686 [Drosophila yakuba]|uniref:Uncharacterized protein n=1 Tax=Drosophila yakuba TaxID=7245 RepID=A0A0R1DZT1_DROYA|nr:LOW QUALITY PROTEIN: uncharacterized protein Dyak_GE28686 [Drosophila yakuba]